MHRIGIGNRKPVSTDLGKNQWNVWIMYEEINKARHSMAFLSNGHFRVTKWSSNGLLGMNKKALPTVSMRYQSLESLSKQYETETIFFFQPNITSHPPRLPNSTFLRLNPNRRVRSLVKLQHMFVPYKVWDPVRNKKKRNRKTNPHPPTQLSLPGRYETRNRWNERARLPIKVTL